VNILSKPNTPPDFQVKHSLVLHHNYHQSKIDILELRIELDQQNKPIFPLQIQESNLLTLAFGDFSNFHNNKAVLITEVIEWKLSRKCFVYLLWMYMGLKFKNFAVPNLY
jgi:hypothetical protein